VLQARYHRRVSGAIQILFTFIPRAPAPIPGTGGATPAAVPLLPRSGTQGEGMGAEPLHTTFLQPDLPLQGAGQAGGAGIPWETYPRKWG
jgi:hypothetical protein